MVLVLVLVMHVCVAAVRAFSFILLSFSVVLHNPLF